MGTPLKLRIVTPETAAAIERLERSGIVREFEHALRVDVGYSVEFARAALRRDRMSAAHAARRGKLTVVQPSA